MLVVTVMSVVSVSAQKDTLSVNFSGDIGYYTKNLSTFTGLMFGENPSVVSHMNVCANYKNLNISAAYSGQHSINHLEDGDRFNMLDLSVGYKVNKEFGLCTGYELTYSDNEIDDEFGHGIFAMATWSKNKVLTNFIFFADPTFKSTYYIASVDVKVSKNVSVYSLGEYTNTKSTRWYGLGGLKYSKGNFFAGTYYMLDKDTPGPVVSIGMTF